MVCEEFINGFSDYRDGLLSREASDRFARHLDACASCRRYERVLTRGLALCRALPHPTSSPDFAPRLQHRLYHVEDAGRLTPRRHLGSAALIAVASVGFLAVTWLPFATRMSVEVELPAVAVRAPAAALAQEQPSLFGKGPYVRPLNRFVVPLNATLDESGSLFTTSFLTVAADTARGLVARRSGQLDESR